MAEESGQEKTEAATPKRLEDSRKKGQVPRSRDFNTLLSLLGGGLGGLVLGPNLVTQTMEIMRSGLDFNRARAFDDLATLTATYEAMQDFVWAMLPLLTLMFMIAFAGPLLLGGWSFSGQALMPKFERISPLKGLARIFSVNSLVELVKSILKFFLVSVVAVTTLWQISDWLFALGLAPLAWSLPSAGSKLIWCFLAMSSAMILVALLDVPFQLWDHARKLRMTKQEIKDELKESEGRPEVKAQIRYLQQEASQKRMLRDVPSADVIITNPTHYAVALRYADGEMNAPVVVAKGKDLVAARIREIATEAGIPLFPAPPLARALYASVETGQVIPANLFAAVAKVLAYVFQLRAKVGGQRITKPSLDSLIPDTKIDSDNNGDS